MTKYNQFSNDELFSFENESRIKAKLKAKFNPRKEHRRALIEFEKSISEFQLASDYNRETL